MVTGEGFIRHKPLILISILIIVLLFIQASASFRLFCLPNILRFELTGFRICDPSLWPFMSYPMYSMPHYPGERLDRPRIYAILGDRRQMLIRHTDLGLTITQYINLYRELLEARDEELALTVSSLFEQSKGDRVIAIRLANHPAFFTKSGFFPGPVRSTRTIWLQPAWWEK
jgi:hypothetical protein